MSPERQAEREAFWAARNRAPRHGWRPTRKDVERCEQLEANSNRQIKRVAWAAARKEHPRCDQGRGWISNKVTHQKYKAPCRAWRTCRPCARAYGAALSVRWTKVTELHAFVVLTMPADRGDWRDDWNRRAQMRAWRRLYERLVRYFGYRPKSMFFKEHAGKDGRLHMNVIWSWPYIDKRVLFGKGALADQCGFGEVGRIREIGEQRCELSHKRPGSALVRYSKKQGFRVVCYAKKTGSQTEAGDDWPKGTRRWASSRAASREMGPRAHNPEWQWTSNEPSFEEPVSETNYWLLPDQYLPARPGVPEYRAGP